MIDPHSTCPECGKLVNTILHGEHIRNGACFHELCLKRHEKRCCAYKHCPAHKHAKNVHEYDRSPDKTKPLEMHLTCWTRWRDLGFPQDLVSL